jgi:hypothetical protein
MLAALQPSSMNTAVTKWIPYRMNKQKISLDEEKREDLGEEEEIRTRITA